LSDFVLALIKVDMCPSHRITPHRSATENKEHSATSMHYSFLLKKSLQPYQVQIARAVTVVRVLKASTMITKDGNSNPASARNPKHFEQYKVIHNKASHS
jgi:hypothetical protein